MKKDVTKGQPVVLKKLDIVADLRQVKGGYVDPSTGTGRTIGDGGPVCW
jgi:hypothetical protein